MDYYAIPQEDYIEHHGIKGQKWGVRRTPAQLGHEITKTTRSIGTRINQAKNQHTKNVVARNKRKTARYNAKQQKIQAKNELLESKAQQEELKARIRKAKQDGRDKNKSDNKKENEIAKSAKQGLNQGIQNGVSTATKNLVTTAVSAAVTRHYSDILVDPNTSAGKKAFASLMGGTAENSAHVTATNEHVKKVIAENRAARYRDQIEMERNRNS